MDRLWKNLGKISHQERLAYCTGSHPIMLAQYQKVTNWGQLADWHLKYQPNINKDSIGNLMKLYHLEAKDKMQKGTLCCQQQWMSVFNL